MRLVRVRSKWHTKKVFNKETTPSPAHGNKPNKQCGRGHYTLAPDTLVRTVGESWRNTCAR